MMGLHVTGSKNKRKYQDTFCTSPENLQNEYENAAKGAKLDNEPRAASQQQGKTEILTSSKQHDDTTKSDLHQHPHHQLDCDDSISKLQAVAVPDETNWRRRGGGGGADEQQQQAKCNLANSTATAAAALTDEDDFDGFDDLDDEFDYDEEIESYYPPAAAAKYPPNNRQQQRVVTATTPAPPPSSSPSPQQQTAAAPHSNKQDYVCEQYANSPSPRQPPPSGIYIRYHAWNGQIYENELQPQDPPQTIRCAENGKSYTELGTYTFFGSHTPRYIKRCCDGKNSMCNNKQCYKEKRLRMMNLSMFKLSRFRQASDQSLYRSVLICNTLKRIEREIEHEKRDIKRHMVPKSVVRLENFNSISSNTSSGNRPAEEAAENHQQQQRCFNNSSSGSNNSSSSNNNNNKESSIKDLKSSNLNCEVSNNSSNSSNGFQSFTNHDRTSLAGPDDSTSSHHFPLKDPQSGRATPFPAPPGFPDNDSGYGETESEKSPDFSRPINWGSVLSLSSQSALDPLNNNDFFNATPPYFNGGGASSTPTASSYASSQASSCHSPNECNGWADYLDSDMHDMISIPNRFGTFSDEFLFKGPWEPSKAFNENEENFSTHILVNS